MTLGSDKVRRAMKKAEPFDEQDFSYSVSQSRFLYNPECDGVATPCSLIPNELVGFRSSKSRTGFRSNVEVDFKKFQV